MHCIHTVDASYSHNAPASRGPALGHFPVCLCWTRVGPGLDTQTEGSATITRPKMRCREMTERAVECWRAKATACVSEGAAGNAPYICNSGHFPLLFLRHNCACTLLPICVCARTRMSVCAQVCVCMCVCTVCMHECVCVVHVHVCTRMWRSKVDLGIIFHHFSTLSIKTGSLNQAQSSPIQEVLLINLLWGSLVSAFPG